MSHKRGVALEQQIGRAPIRVEHWFPRVPSKLLPVSFIVALASAVAVFPPAAQSAWTNVPAWASHASYVIDPVIVQGLSVLAVCGIILRFHGRTNLRTASTIRRFARFAFVALVILAPLLCLYGLQLVWLKPAFEFNRPTSFVGDSFILDWLGWTRDGRGSACPSGFVLRQTLLLHLGLSFVGLRSEESASRDEFDWNWFSVLAISFLIVSTFLIALLRVVRQAHTPFDVAMGVAVGTYVFWLGYYFVGVSLALLQRRSDRELLELLQGQLLLDLVAMSAVFIPLFLFYSHTASYWSISVLIVLFVLGLTQYVMPLRPFRQEHRIATGVGHGDISR